MLLLKSLRRLLSSYTKICMRASFELLIYPYGRNRAKTPVRRSLRGTAKERQNKNIFKSEFRNDISKFQVSTFFTKIPKNANKATFLIRL